jgi:hypothetical protein
LVVCGGVFGGGFAVGRLTAPEVPAANFARGGFPAGEAGSPDQGLVVTRGGAVTGTITALEAGSITITADDGTTQTFTTTSETTVTDVTSVEVSDLELGDAITVMTSGTEGNSDGAEARSITRGTAGIGVFGGPVGPGAGQWPADPGGADQTAP